MSVGAPPSAGVLPNRSVPQSCRPRPGRHRDHGRSDPGRGGRNEVVQWGRRYQARVRDKDAYLAALLATSSQEGRDDHRFVEAVGRHLVALLDLDRCRWESSVDLEAPRLDPDGQVRHDGRVLPVDDEGLPTDSVIVLPVRTHEGSSAGYALPRPPTSLARPFISVDWPPPWPPMSAGPSRRRRRARHRAHGQADRSRWFRNSTQPATVVSLG